MSIKRLFVEKKKGFDIEAEELKSDLVENLGLSGLTGVRVINRYDIDGISDEELQKVLPSVYAEPQVDNVEFENIEIPSGDKYLFQNTCRVSSTKEPTVRHNVLR